MITYYTSVQSPVGELMLTGDADALTGVIFPSEREKRPPDVSWTRAEAPFAEAVSQLGAYFARELRVFDLVLAPRGTPFQKEVWKALASIRYGETVSYGELAARIGRPDAPRAVGAANGRNPLPIVVPCHRVIGADGSLTGFGGGLAIKRWLLDHESALPATAELF